MSLHARASFSHPVIFLSACPTGIRSIGVIAVAKALETRIYAACSNNFFCFGTMYLSVLHSSPTLVCPLHFFLTRDGLTGSRCGDFLFLFMPGVFVVDGLCTIDTLLALSDGIMYCARERKKNKEMTR